MFESISIIPDDDGNASPIDVGMLAEKMLYYKNVNVFVNKEDFYELFKYFDADLVIEYIKRGYLSLIYRKQTLRTQLFFNNFQFGFSEDYGYDLEEIISDAFWSYSDDEEKSRAVAKKLAKHISEYEVSSEETANIKMDLTDESFTRMAASIAGSYLSPPPYEELRFKLEPSLNGFVIDSNLDPRDFTDSNADDIFIIRRIITALEQIKIAARYSSELSIPRSTSKLVATKMNSLIKKASASDRDIDVFQYTEFPDAPSIKDLINNRHRNMEEYLNLLEKGDKFKSWLTDLGDGNKLIREYYKKIGETGWMQSMPSKTLRFYLVQGISTILKATGTLSGIAAGISLSAANTFLVEKLVKGWKPNHFIEGTVKPFIEKE